MRVLLVLILSLFVTLSSLSEAFARFEMAVASGMMPCGADSHTVDGKGHPIHIHCCIDCLAAAMLADLPSPVCLPVAPVTRSARVTLTLATQTASPMTRTPTARGPPVLTS